MIAAEDMEAQIAHDRGHQSVSGKKPPLLQVQAAGGNDLVAVDFLPGFIYHEAPVRVPVEGHAQIVSSRCHHTFEPFQVGGAALVVDVHPVGPGMNHIGVQAGEACEQPGGGGGSGAIGAVHQNMRPRKGPLHRGGQIANIILALLLVGVDHPANLPMGLEGQLLAAQYQSFNLPLQSVGELEALAVEDFNAVVLKGVVGGGDDNSRVRPGVHRDPGHTGGGNDPQMEHVRPGGAQPRNQGSLQQIGGNAGILADGEPGASAPLLLGEHLRRRHTHPKGQLGVQSLVDYAANTVCSE